MDERPDTDDLPAIDPDLMRRIEAAKDERGVIHDADLANEYFLAMQAQSAEVAKRFRRTNPPAPTVDGGADVFPTTGPLDGEL